MKKIEKELLKVPYDEKVIFQKRKNRFLGSVRFENGNQEEVHVRDPGRLEELLYEENEVLLKKADNENRKTNWDLIGAWFDDQWILVNSGYHREITECILEDESISPFGIIDSYKPEVKLGVSRIDFLIKKDEVKIWTEVKGCTLAKNEEALFPDAPTKRGKKHVEELIRVSEREKTSAALIFLIFRSDASCFAPNQKQDPEFTRVFKKAIDEGVDIYPLQLKYDGFAVEYCGEIPMCEEY